MTSRGKYPKAIIVIPCHGRRNHRRPYRIAFDEMNLRVATHLRDEMRILKMIINLIKCVVVDKKLRVLTAATCFLYLTTFFRRRACTPITSSYIHVTKQKPEQKGIEAISKNTTT